MYGRHLESILERSLGARPAVYLRGGRQVGKTTLARSLAARRGFDYRTFDDATLLSAAERDPVGFIGSLRNPTVLDEVQRVPDLLLAIKESVDRDRRPGRILLTGSADVLALPRVAGVLVGRMDVLTLYPLSQGEIEGTPEGFVDTLFSGSPIALREPPLPGLLPQYRVRRGGFPELVARGFDPDAWFDSYVTTVLQRDVRDLANIEGLSEMPRLLRLIATRQPGLLNSAGLSRESGIPQTSLKRYLALLEATFLIQFLPPWFANLGKRIVKSPKVMLGDTGLASFLLGLDTAGLVADRSAFGHMLESLVILELRKQITWSRSRPTLYHYRSHDGSEVDAVLERRDGRVAAVEVKAAATVVDRDFKAMRALEEGLGDRFAVGVVLHTGEEIVPFGERFLAAPVRALWDARAGRAVGTS